MSICGPTTLCVAACYYISIYLYIYICGLMLLSTYLQATIYLYIYICGLMRLSTYLQATIHLYICGCICVCGLMLLSTYLQGALRSGTTRLGARGR
jgi:hypothetical protein